MGRNAESIIQETRKIYQSYGYSLFKMNRFEEYDTYVNNKDFLKSDKVITFTDTNGKLLAMKPDVTISIIKNSEDTPGLVQKVYYNENVYRVSDGSHAFKEIMQTGLECIGDIDAYNICEVILLAAKTLESVSEKFVLDISHLGLVSALIKACTIDESSLPRVLSAISEKNLPELTSICEENSLDEAMQKRLLSLVDLYGTVSDFSDKLDMFCVDEATTDAAKELNEICTVLKSSSFADRIQIDFSVVNDMNYYNGIVFKGYVDGVYAGILSGGQYDRLMHKMGKKSKGLGFAMYLDLLERLFVQSKEFDADVLLCYDRGVAPLCVAKKAEEIIAAGKTVLVQHCISDSVRCKKTIMLSKGADGK
ncbi:MAG: ATP phosphoribosyltransferase regulatory subunit [Clostridia bacterium]|nr:ATP phosphoribosyltransferase regulatory subunit [Clostridia bacterium]